MLPSRSARSPRTTATASAESRVRASTSSMLRAFGRMLHVGQRSAGRADPRRWCPSPGTTPNSCAGRRARDFEKDRDPLHRAGIDHGDQAALEAAVIRERTRRRKSADESPPPAGPARARCNPPCGGRWRRCRPTAPTRSAACALGIPTGGAERVRTAACAPGTPRGPAPNDAPRAAGRVPDPPRHQHPVGLELANLLAQHLHAPRRILDREHGDGFVMAQFGALARRRRRRCGTRAPRAPGGPARSDCCAWRRRAEAA